MVERRRIALADGTRGPSDRWVMRFSDRWGRRRELYLFQSKGASEAFERRVRELLDSGQGGAPLSPGLLRWVLALAPKYRERLVRWGLIDESRVAAVGALDDLIDAWDADLEARAVSEEHRRRSVLRVRTILDGIGATAWVDVNTGTVQRELTRRCKGRRGWGARTHNSYAASLKQLSHWLWRQKITMDDTLGDLRKRSAGSGAPRHPRRSATPEEIGRLLEATARSPKRIRGMEPRDRQLLYWAAVLTGLRISELGRWRVVWIHWSTGEGPSREAGHLEMMAHDTKGGKTSGKRSTLPLQADFEAGLRVHCEGKALGELVFPALPVRRGAEMLRHDLEAAGIEYVDDAGRWLDFHALRHTFVSWASRVAPTASEHKELARHSNYAQTAIYTHTAQGDLAGVIERMPALSFLIQDRPDSEGRLIQSEIAPTHHEAKK